MVVGTHPIPMKYFSEHEKMSFWSKMNMPDIAPELFSDTEAKMRNYD